MTIDLTNAADAGWMSFTLDDEGEMDDGRRRARINRGKSRHIIIAIETDENDVPTDVEIIERSENNPEGFDYDALRWLYKAGFEQSPPEAIAEERTRDGGR